MPCAGSSVSALRSSPYQGLVPYSADDAPWFFGREEWTRVVIDNLRAYRISVLYGASGVGKSSLLHAGVVPALHAASREDVLVSFGDWSAADPAAAFRDRAGLPREGALADALTARADERGGVVYVVLDQLEDLFLYHGRAGGLTPFEEELASVIRRRNAPVNVLLSIREDALAALDRLHARVPTLLDNLIRVEHLDRDDAREAVVRPLERWNELEAGDGAGVAIEPELVEETLRQVQAGKLVIRDELGAGRAGGDPAETRVEAPYLQLVLTRLWDEERAAGSRTLHLATLERLGGADEIVRTHLDAALAGLSKRERDLSWRVFRQLVTPSGTKIAHRPGDLAEYAGVSEAATDGLLQKLSGQTRILRRLPDGAYEIFHDALAGPIVAWRQRYATSQLGRRRAVRRAAFAAASIAIGVGLVLAYFSTAFATLERQSVDARFAIRGSVDPDPRVKLVGIDDETFSQLHMRWPLPRSLHAKVIDRLSQDGAKVIAFDVQFTEPTTPRQDNALIGAVDSARNVVLATTEVDTGGRTNVLGGTPKAFHFVVGNALLTPDADEVIRRVRYSIDGLETFALAAARRGGEEPSLRGSEAWVDYAGPARTYTAVSYADVLRGRFRTGTFRGKYVVVGATAPALQDLHPTPTTSSSSLMSGPEIQANALASALEGYPLDDLGDGGNALLIAALSLLAPLVAVRVRLGVTSAVVLASAVAYLVAAQLAFQHGLVLPVSYPVVVLVLTAVGALFVDVGIPRELRGRFR
jgi:CHASE2 domain-containing sensor protein